MKFHDPWLLLLLLTVPALAWFMLARRGRRLATLRFSAVSLVKDAALRSAWARAETALIWVRVVALLLVVIALARPRLVGKPIVILREGIDIVVVLDVSTSMRAADFSPSRLEVAKRVAARFVGKRSRDRVGLVVFAGQAFTMCPLTFDRAILIQVMKKVRTGVIQDGTAIGNALGTALNLLRRSKAKSKVVVLVTDGENNRGNIHPMQAAKIAQGMGVKAYTILVGKGGRVPYPVRRDLFGRTVYRPMIIPANSKLLRRISTATGARSYTAADRRGLEGSFQRILDQLERARLKDPAALMRYRELLPWLLGPALLLLLLECLLRLTRARRVP